MTQNETNPALTINVENLDACKRRIKAQIPVQEVEAEMQRYFDHIAKTVALPGFRAGKVPMSILRTKYKQEALDEASRSLLCLAYQRAVEEKNLRPVFSPAVETLDAKPGEPMTIELNVEVEPEIKIPDYAKIPLTQTTASDVADKEVDAFIENLRESKAVYNEAENAVAGWGDYVQSDFELKVDGKTLENRPDAWFIIMQHPSSQELFAPLVGKSAGATAEGRARLSEQFPNKEAAGKEAEYRFVLKQIKKKSLPAMDDALAKDFALETLAQLREKVRTYIQNEKQGRVRMELESAAAKYLVEKTGSVPMPENLFNSRVENLVRERQQRLGRRAAGQEGEQDPEKNRQELRRTAEEEVRRALTLQFLVNAVFDKENMTLSPEEVHARRERILAEVHPSQKDLIRAWHSDSGTTVLVQDLKREKVMDLVIKQAEIRVAEPSSN